MELIATIIALAVAIEYLVDGAKDLLPENLAAGNEKLISLIVSVFACLALPYITIIPVGALATCTVVERIVIAIFVSRGSNVFYDLVRKIEGGVS